ncbi:CRAL/TRIO domain-containing protein [Coprinopsis sp. MPI-PUGE-AT-0042]|nr:CRAL/TRIO domain-containing protein [Coprinopsis sp. MPI-PUGE-AT-0042]
MSVKTRNVLREPEPGTTIRPVYTYTEEQTKMIESLKEYTTSITLPPSDSYHHWETRWLSRPDTHPRYMRAAKWNLADAEKRIKATLEWRRDFKPDLIIPDDVKIESETGKIILNGFDSDGRPVIYMRPGLENTERSDRQLRHLVWWLERAKDLMPAGQESLVIIVDYRSCTLRTNPSISIARKVLNILQQHYVETLGRACVVNLPFILNFFYKGISPFLDPVTRDKMRFNPNLLDLIPANQLDADFGGSYQWEFEPNSYWDQIVEMCGIAPDGTRTKPRTTTATTSSATGLDSPMSALSLDGTDDVSSRSRADSDCSESSLSDTESKGPVTPRTAIAEPLDIRKVDETALADATVDKTRELMA